MPVTRRRSVIAAAGALLLLLVLSGCTLAGTSPAPLTPVSPDELEDFEPIQPEGAVEGVEVIETPTQLAPVDAFGTQTAAAPLEGQPAGEATPLGEEAGEAAATPEAGASPAAEATAAPAAGQCPITYTIEQGDTLFGLALEYGVTVEAIVAASNLSDPDRLALGDQVTIPCPEEGAPAAQPAPAPAGETTAGGDILYTVQPGDNLFRIALNHGLTVDELAAYNNISDPTRLSVGQQIRIPQN